MKTNTIINDVNYGELVCVEIDGVQGFADKVRVEHLGFDYTYKDASKIRTQLHLDLVYGFSGIYFYFEHGQDIRKFACRLTRLTGRDAWVSASARYLGLFRAGAMAGEPRKLSDFYTGITPEQEEEVKF